jgi:hypothetical protein
MAHLMDNGLLFGRWLGGVGRGGCVGGVDTFVEQASESRACDVGRDKVALTVTIEGEGMLKVRERVGLGLCR